MVERFDLDEGGFLGERGRMVPDEFGDYVHVTDYADLERQLAEARLREETADKLTVVWRDKFVAAEAERDRLAAEMDRIERALCCAEHGHNINEVLANYRAIRRGLQDRRAALAGKE